MSALQLVVVRERNLESSLRSGSAPFDEQSWERLDDLARLDLPPLTDFAPPL